MLDASIVHCWHAFGASLTSFRYPITSPVSCSTAMILAAALSPSISQKGQMRGNLNTALQQVMLFEHCVSASSQSFVKAWELQALSLSRLYAIVCIFHLNGQSTCQCLNLIEKRSLPNRPNHSTAHLCPCRNSKTLRFF